jgi:3-oxoacyl-[acyl-carrier protein] reductase
VNIDLQGKIAIVTGSGTGIGQATARELTRAGATVVISDVLHAEGKATAKELSGDSFYIPCDVTQREQVDGLVAAAVERFGKLDIMVNNAGVNARQDERVTTECFSDETWHRIINCDLHGCFYGCRAAGQQMVKQGSGSIINIASVAGVVALRLQVAFVAAKAAVIKMTEAMACELGPKGLRVNVVSPGSTATESNKPAFFNPDGSLSELAAKITSFIPMNRPGWAEEMACAVAFLASDQAAYINGHNLIVDGGWTCGFNRDF